MKLKWIISTLIFIILISLASCVSLMEKTGKALDGSAFKEKKISRYKAFKKNNSPADIEMLITQNKNDEKFIIISLPDFPMMKLRSSFPKEDNVSKLISLEYLAGHSHGWNEYTLDLLGETIIIFIENIAILEASSFENIQINNGRIHSYDSRITGNEALTALRNRRDRIIAMVDFMKTLNINQEVQSIKDFEKYWKPILFPEIVLKNKPSGWKQKDDTFVFQDDIRWNTSYTERVFSEDLRPVRNSGTMLRDWEEALSWIYMEYYWENIINVFTKEIIFNKIK